MITEIKSEPTLVEETNYKNSFIHNINQSVPGGDSGIYNCIQCGTCGGTCPSGPDMEITPRGLFALIAAGKREKVLKSNTFWYCLSCYQCIVRCPQDIKITDIMYALKRRAIREGYYIETKAKEAPGFSGTFMEYVENYGRSFEFGLATRHNLRYRPLDALKIVPLGLGMWRKGRMNLKPNKIKNLKQLKAILKKARELGGTL